MARPAVESLPVKVVAASPRARLGWRAAAEAGGGEAAAEASGGEPAAKVVVASPLLRLVREPAAEAAAASPPRGWWRRARC